MTLPKHETTPFIPGYFFVLKLKLLQGATLLYLPHRRTGSQDRFRTVDGLRRGKEASGAAQSLGGMR